MSGYRALVCVTSCDRVQHLRRYLPHLAAFVAGDRRFDLVVALDGPGEDYLEFCRRWGVSLVWSDAREGVGLSKNRVLERHPGYDHYFFLDDDAELVDGQVFPAHVALAEESGIHHLSLFERGGLRKPTGATMVGKTRIAHGMFGGGQFNFFTREGLERVGGWHPRFAEWRRWGHTEHSWRFWRAGLAPAPFNVAEVWSDAFIWHYPPAVTPRDALPADEDQLVAPERALLEEERTHVPLTTLAPHHTNGIPPGAPTALAETLRSGERYPLVEGQERRRCRADYHLWRSGRADGVGERLGALARAVVAWPGNPLLRHRVRRWMGRS